MAKKNGFALGRLFQNTINYFSKFSNNASIVSRAKQYSGEWSKELPYSRYYEYYHQTPSVKRNINSIHKRWMGSLIEVTSQNPQFDFLFERWNAVTNFIPKLKVFALDTLITGTGVMEKQYMGSTFANIEHIPTKTIWKIYRDEFAEKLSIWQMIDGDIKELSPDNMAVFTINNPENDAVGKSALYALAVPQRVAGKLDELGNPINPERYLPSILDTKMRLNYAHMEIAEKQAKSRFFVSIEGMKDKDRQQQIEKDLENEASSKYITVTDGKVTAVPIQFSKDVANERYLEDIDKQINQGSGFPGDVIDKGGEMGFASAQVPIQDLSMNIEDMQNDLSAFVQNEIFTILCDQWNMDYNTVQPKLIFNTFVEKVTFEQTLDLMKIPNVKLTDTEQRNLMRQFLPGMEDDKSWEEFKQETEQKQLEQVQAGKPENQNPRPDIEKERPKPDKTIENHPLFKNPKAFEEYIHSSVKRAIEVSMPHTFIPKGRTYPEDCQCIYCGLAKGDIVHNITGQSTESQGYSAMPPVNGEKFEAPYPEITNPETIIRVKQMLEDVKSGKLKAEDVKDEVDRISKEADNISYWIKELTEKHKDWKHDQVVAVAIQKSKESYPEKKAEENHVKKEDLIELKEAVSNLTTIAKEAINEGTISNIKLEKQFEKFKKDVEATNSRIQDVVNKKSIESQLSISDKKKLSEFQGLINDLKDTVNTKSIEADLLLDKRNILKSLKRKLDNLDTDK